MEKRSVEVNNNSRRVRAVVQSILAVFVVISILRFAQSGTNLWNQSQKEGKERYDAGYNSSLYTELHDNRIADAKLMSMGRSPSLDPSYTHLHVGKKAMVSSDVPICSTMGKQILLRGGNAADAAVTVALCIGSINSASSGIGGGGFILSSKNDTKDAISIDAREMAPGASVQDMFEANPILAIVGGLSSGIPGELKGLDVLFKRHGSGNLSWYDVIEPVIKLNREGFECTQVLEVCISVLNDRYFSRIPQLSKSWDFIYNDDGSLKTIGDVVTRPALANTLEMVARNGSSDIFYDPEGPIAKNLININRKYGGIFTDSDFRDYHVIVEAPLTHRINDEYEILTSNGISSGVVLLSGINLFKKLYNSKDEIYLTVHKIIETMKWMASVRTRLGANNNDYKEVIANYTSNDWAENIKTTQYSDEKTFPWEHYDPLYEMTEPHGTSHFSVLDENDNGVSMTTTVNLLFGSIVYDPITGIILNNEMDDFLSKSFNNSFDLAPSKYNLVTAYKRPLSSTAPTIIMRSGVPDLLIGAAGGSRITTAIFQAIIRVYQLNLSLLRSISYPRFHDQLIPDYTLLENLTMFKEEFGSGTMHKLVQMGHKFRETGVETTMNGIKRIDKEIHGVSDYWRKAGEADGY